MVSAAGRHRWVVGVPMKKELLWIWQLCPCYAVVVVVLFQTSLVNQSAVRGQCCDGVFSHRSVDGFSCLLAGVQALLKQPRTLVLPGIL